MYSLTQCLKDIDYLKKELASAQKIISRMPDGKLNIQKKNGKYYYYRRVPGRIGPEYISKKDTAKIKGLAYRRYYEVKSAYCRSMLNALKAFKEKLDSSIMSPEYYIEQNPGIGQVLDLRNAMSPEIQAWLDADYPKNLSHPEELKIKTNCGIYVRSKSECMIADALSAAGIPFKYDFVRSFGLPSHAESLSPDFLIPVQGSNDFIIWEHFGLMDDPGYMQHVAKKLLLYMESGYIPGKNLIITMESRECPLDSDTIHSMINKFLR